MFFHHSKTSFSFKLSFIFVFGLVCAAFVTAMPISSVSSNQPVAVSMLRSDVNSTIIPRHELKKVDVTVSFAPGIPEPLPLPPVSQKIQHCLELVASELGFIASISDTIGKPYGKQGVVYFMMAGSGSYYAGQMAAEDIVARPEKSTTFRLKMLDGEHKGRVVRLISDGSVQSES
ncbi:hypothetical protein GG344DRAFT_64438 [Lentinula edodes]|nr:hypothetical protein GG344DRAFT_64438 [Lentinula edodes]